ncbi:serine/threonine protein kinase, partial [Streptomyces sp. SID339]|nr:serine/threonine protein kinase [Streptomyces sp. SID339]
PPPTSQSPVAPSRAETRAEMRSTQRRPRRGRALLAAAAVAVVLAATGATVAVLNGEEDKGNQAREGTTAGGAASNDDDGSSGPLGGESERPKPSGQGDEKPRERRTKPSDDAADAAKRDGTGKDGKDASDRDADTSKDGGKTPSRPDATTKPTEGGSAPDPVCHPAGGGKYNCEVWRTANSYTAGGARVGTLNAGTNYFYCQQNLGRRETSGQWTNVWWAKTDDDSGNTNVFVSDVYVKGGDNDKPLPGLPVC